MELDTRLVEVLTALVILGVAAALVSLVLVVAQRAERRRILASGASAGDERRAGREELDDLAHSDRSPARSCSGAVIVSAASIIARPVVPWRAVPCRDLSGLSRHRHAISHAWSEAESDGLVDLFRVGFDLVELAAELDIEPCSIVEELSRRVFGAIDPVADPHARRFGQEWTEAELRTLYSAARAGLAVPEIARQLGRDQLSVVFRILEAPAEDAAAASPDAPRSVRPALPAVTPDRREVALHG